MVVIYWRSTKNKKNSHVTTIKHVAVAVVEGVRGTEDALTVCEVEVEVVIEMAGGTLSWSTHLRRIYMLTHLQIKINSHIINLHIRPINMLYQN